MGDLIEDRPVFLSDPSSPRYLMGFRSFCAGIMAVALILIHGQSRSEVVERIAAIINNDIITLSELDEMIDAVQGPMLESISNSDQRHQKRNELRLELLEQMIDQKLLTQQYAKLEIFATEGDIDRTVDSICTQNSITKAELKQELSQQGISYTDYRDQLRQGILQTKFIEQQIRPRINISEDDVKRLYTQKMGGFSGTLVATLDGILVNVPRSAGPSAIEAGRKTALKTGAQLRQGMSPDDIARQSTDGSIESLPQMGSFKRGELMEPLDSAVFKLKEGQVTEPIELSQGMYVLRLLKLSKEVDSRPYEEVRNQLTRQLYDQAIETQLQMYARNIRKESHVHVLFQ